MNPLDFFQKQQYIFFNRMRIHKLTSLILIDTACLYSCDLYKEYYPINFQEKCN